MHTDAARQPVAAVLKDGTPVTVRPIRPDDAPRLQAFHQRLSPTSIYLRWLSAHPVLTEAEAAQLSNLDYDLRMAFVATQPDGAGEAIRGVARYGVVDAARPSEAEAAIIVEDSFQGRGLGSLLIRHLVGYARAHGVRTFVAEINAENARMLRFIQRGGLPVTKRLESGSWQVHIDLTAPISAANEPASTREN